MRFLGRRHDRDEAIAAIRLARDTFPRYSFDLIYARPGQSLAAWDAELGEALALAGEHLSLYQLTIEPGTAFGNRAARGETLAADEETAAALFELTQRRLERPGCRPTRFRTMPGPAPNAGIIWPIGATRIISASAPARMAASRGTGGKIATAQLRQPEAWLAAIESAGTAIEEEIPIARESAVEEMVMMGLRLVEGVSRPRLEALADADVETLFGPRLPRLIEGGFLTLDSERLAATEAGRQRFSTRFWRRCSRNHSPICSSAPRRLALRKAIKKIAAPTAR